MGGVSMVAFSSAAINGWRVVIALAVLSFKASVRFLVFSSRKATPLSDTGLTTFFGDFIGSRQVSGCASHSLRRRGLSCMTSIMSCMKLSVAKRKMLGCGASVSSTTRMPRLEFSAQTGNGACHCTLCLSTRLTICFRPPACRMRSLSNYR